MKRESSASITDEEISSSTRRAKPMKLKEVTAVPKKRGSLRCKDCPKWHPSYCSITCQPKVAGVPACTYGKQLINVEKQKVRNELKRAKAEKKTKKNVRA